MTSRARERQLRVRDHATVASLEGDDRAGAQTVVLVHSALLDRRMWAPFTTPLLGLLGAASAGPPAGAGYRVLTYDLRGHGVAGDAPPITGIGQLATDLAAVLDELGVGSAHVCGLSLGGAVAQAFARGYPHRTRSLTLVATDLAFPVEVMDARARAFTPEQRDETIATTLRRWFSPETLTRSAPAVRYARDCLLATSAERWSAAWRALGRFDNSDHAGHFRAPVLAVSGAQDLATPPARLEAVARSYHGGRHVTVDPGPHLLSLERGDVLAEQVAPFLVATCQEGQT